MARLANCESLKKPIDASPVLLSLVVNGRSVHIFQRIWELKNFNNLSVFGEDMDGSLMSCFLLRICC